MRNVTRRIFTLAVGVAILVAGVATATPIKAREGKEDTHKAMLRRLVDEVFNKGNFAVMDEVYAADYTQTDPAGRQLDLKTYKDSLMRQRQAVPDVQGAVVQLVAEGDWVAGRYYLAGTFKNEFMAGTGQKVPPTGKPVAYAVSTLHRFNDKDQIVEEILTRDDLGIYMQLGVIPMPKDAPAMKMMDVKAVKEIMPNAMSPDDEALARKNTLRVADDVFTQGKIEAVDELFDPHYMEYDNEDAPINLATFKQQVAALHAAMPDLKATADPIIVEGDWAAFGFQHGGTFKNTLVAPTGQKIPPTGKPLQQMAIIFVHYNDKGQCTEAYFRGDNLSFLVQAGVIKLP
ncbi:MAG: ester cyclase [Anaerolineae bacterium]|nr:ester cyclase [Anaerolineae bacterium]